MNSSNETDPPAARTNSRNAASAAVIYIPQLTRASARLESAVNKLAR